MCVCVCVCRKIFCSKTDPTNIVLCQITKMKIILKDRHYYTTSNQVNIINITRIKPPPPIRNSVTHRRFHNLHTPEQCRFLCKNNTLSDLLRFDSNPLKVFINFFTIRATEKSGNIACSVLAGTSKILYSLEKVGT